MTAPSRARADAAAARADREATRRKRRARQRRWIEKEPGQLRSIRVDLQGGDARRLSVAARRMLVLIAARPDVMRSRTWTTAKTARVTIDNAQLRRHFHRWSASVARAALTLKARLAAAELERQEKAFYDSLEATLEAEEREETHRFAHSSEPDPEADYAVLNDALRDEEEEERRKVEERGLDGPYIRLTIIDGGLS